MTNEKAGEICEYPAYTHFHNPQVEFSPLDARIPSLRRPYLALTLDLAL